MSDDDPSKDEEGDLATKSEEFFDVEAIVSHMTFQDACKKLRYGENGFNSETFDDMNHCKYIYRIKWLGYSSDENTWEEEENLTCDEILTEYKKKNGLPADLVTIKFSVKLFLTHCFRQNDPDLTEDVRAYIDETYIIPDKERAEAKERQKEEIRRMKEEKRQKERERYAARASKSRGGDAKTIGADDVPFSLRKKVRKSVRQVERDLTAPILVEREEKLDLLGQTYDRSAKETKERMDGLDYLEQQEKVIKQSKKKRKSDSPAPTANGKQRKTRRSRSSSKSEAEVDQDVETCSEKMQSRLTMDRQKKVAKHSLSLDSDIFSNELDERTAREQPRCVLIKPTVAKKSESLPAVLPLKNLSTLLPLSSSNNSVVPAPIPQKSPVKSFKLNIKYSKDSSEWKVNDQENCSDINMELAPLSPTPKETLWTDLVENSKRESPKGFSLFVKHIEESFADETWRDINAKYLEEMVTAYAFLQAENLAKVFGIIGENNKNRATIVKILLKYIKIDGCEEFVDSILCEKSAVNPRLQRLFDADGVEQRTWLDIPAICSKNHGKCKTIQVVLKILGNNRFDESSPFSPELFYHSIKFGALCQKYMLISWGTPFYTELTQYPGNNEIVVDHSLLVIRQFDLKQLFDLVVKGFDVNQAAWKKDVQAGGRTVLQPILPKNFFQKIIPDDAAKNINMVLGKISSTLSAFDQKRIPALLQKKYEDKSYVGYLTPAHILRAVWPDKPASLRFNTQSQKAWTSWNELNHPCLPLDKDLAEKLMKGEAKLIISLIRVGMQNQIQKDVSQNLKIVDLNAGKCVPTEIQITSMNYKESYKLKPTYSELNVWLFEPPEREQHLLIRDTNFKVAVFTKSNEIGTPFLFRLHVIQETGLEHVKLGDISL